MRTEQPRYDAEATAQRGDEIYERVVRRQVEEGNRGKIVAIDVETEAFDLGDNAIEASDKLLARVPDAEIWFVRIGHSALHRMGGHAVSRTQ